MLSSPPKTTVGVEPDATRTSKRRSTSESKPLGRGERLLLVVLGLLGLAHWHGGSAIPDWAPGWDDVPSVNRRLHSDGEVCACNPSVYRFSLDFSGVCAPPGISTGNSTGVDRYKCDMYNDSGEGTVSPPVVLQAYSVTELDASLQIIKETLREGLELGDGSYFEYTSITASGLQVIDEMWRNGLELDGGERFGYTSTTRASNPLDPKDYPAYLTVAMKGLKANGGEVISQWTTTFTNRCDVVPFAVGDKMGWVVFEELAPARHELCDVLPKTHLVTFVLFVLLLAVMAAISVMVAAGVAGWWWGESADCRKGFAACLKRLAGFNAVDSSQAKVHPSSEGDA